MSLKLDNKRRFKPLYNGLNLCLINKDFQILGGGGGPNL